MTLWEIVFMVVILKIPVAYVGWIVWWAVKAEPEDGCEGGDEGLSLRPWRQHPPRPGRAARASSRGGGARSGSRRSRSRQREGRSA